MNTKTAMYVAAVLVTACAVAGLVFRHGIVNDPARLLEFFVLSTAASACKVRIPRITGTYSIGYVVLLVASAELTPAEVLILAVPCALAQSYWKAARKPQVVQVAFNAANLVISLVGASATFRFLGNLGGARPVLWIGAAAVVYYVVNVGLTVVVLWLTQEGRARRIWAQWNLYTLPYYVLGASLAMIWVSSSLKVSWEGALLALFLLYQLYRLLRFSVGTGIVEETRL